MKISEKEAGDGPFKKKERLNNLMKLERHIDCHRFCHRFWTPIPDHLRAAAAEIEPGPPPRSVQQLHPRISGQAHQASHAARKAHLQKKLASGHQQGKLPWPRQPRGHRLSWQQNPGYRRGRFRGSNLAQGSGFELEHHQHRRRYSGAFDQPHEVEPQWQLFSEIFIF